jgi:hypothetical protein
MAPHKSLGAIKPLLEPQELRNTYFTQGLASIILLNSTISRARELAGVFGGCPLEYWELRDGLVAAPSVTTSIPQAPQTPNQEIMLPTASEPELAVYIEQIAASATCLWAAYGTYFPEETATIGQLIQLVRDLLAQYRSVRASQDPPQTSLIGHEKANAIVSALVELSAAMSYAVTQGTSGMIPILSNRSPFPHHSLLGIGGSVRAITKFTRYLEAAFSERSAIDVIKGQYSVVKYAMPADIAKYDSGQTYKIEKENPGENNHFDQGGEFRQQDMVPLLAHFSLRHGFMESKFSVTAASESLTIETLPPWTLMTLSHEIMHSRVRAIFQALFGVNWKESEMHVVREAHFKEFVKWRQPGAGTQEAFVDAGLRNAILNFCCIMEQAEFWCQTGKALFDKTISFEQVTECYARHKQLAIEVLVHFHDYFFAYACQPKMYLMSLWASWTKVAAPYVRPEEYLIRSLATVACGTGLEPRAAFDFARDKLAEALDAIEAAGIRSPLYGYLRQHVTSSELTPTGCQLSESTRTLFKPLYYLIDQISKFFASPIIASRIDQTQTDPHAEGEVDPSKYSSSIYVFGEPGVPGVSPIRYALRALFNGLTGRNEIDDTQWLTAWNFLVISSQEITK